MYCEFKNNQYWVWSSRLASLDCLPQYKVIASKASDALLSVCSIKQIIAQSKEKAKRLEIDRITYKEKVEAQKELTEFNKTKLAKINNNLLSWAVNLNKGK